MTAIHFEIEYFHDYISPSLAKYLLAQAVPVEGVNGLDEVGRGGGQETPESLTFLVKLYHHLKPELQRVLAQRTADRKFIDERAKACYALNQRLERDFLDPNYQTVLGLEDTHGRIVIGPKTPNFCDAGGKPIAPIPAYLQGPHVTLFGPPDSAKMAINAMNAYHRKLIGEPPIIEELLRTHQSVPKWGADDEDSKTPLRGDLIEASLNLTACFQGALSVDDPETGKHYELAQDHLAVPIKRIPGIALPCMFLFADKNPIPLHLYDFALHLFNNWHNPQALAFYIPKLENEEEAHYIHAMVSTAERMIKELHPSYILGSIRLMIVLENPRAILRIHEIMDVLYPYFVGASLGWHDYLASTARLFKEDANYRIPVKADPYIVIKYIKASHTLLADTVGSRGGIKVGGMYGVLPLGTDITDPSFQVTLKGFFLDVLTQFKRDLTGFWVAHPDFVRLGLAIVEAWSMHLQNNPQPLRQLIHALFSPKYRQELEAFVEKPDVVGLEKSHPQYVRSLLVADIKESDFIPNHHPDEIRYNVFQTLQYLTDWLCGNGCVALPATIEQIPVRVMDDLATTERSRWEVWHELHHKRFPMEQFLQIAHEEMRFIRKDLSDAQKKVQVKWDIRTQKWYPVAFHLMLQLMTAEQPVEFATELLLPFTLDFVREADDPWATVQSLDPHKYQLPPFVKRFHYFFERCGSLRFASALAQDPVLDRNKVAHLIQSFTLEEIQEAAGFHGDIGETKHTLDAMASQEQALVFHTEEATRAELRRLGSIYREKFGFKFLISAQGQSAPALLQALQVRLKNTQTQEIEHAKEALWQITQKRMELSPLDAFVQHAEEARQAFQVTGVSIAIAENNHIQTIGLGESQKGGKKVHPETLFEIASLSKTIASAFAAEYFKQKGICLSTSVNALFAKTASPFRLVSAGDPQWADRVTLRHLMSHCALNVHYVTGTPLATVMPGIEEWLKEPNPHGYPAVRVLHEPGTIFQYSGGGFLVLEHLLESLEQTSIQTLTVPFLQNFGTQLHFEQRNLSPYDYAHGYNDQGQEIANTRLMFPAFAAGAMGSAQGMMQFLQHLGQAFHQTTGSGGISHDTAVEMLHGTDKGCRAFMGCLMGMGVFVAEAGRNRFAIHQGANDGFRALSLHCFSGPDAGKGFVILCNADNRGVLFVAKIAQELLQSLHFTGIDPQRFHADVLHNAMLSHKQKHTSEKPATAEHNDSLFSHSKQEEIVNQGYKHFIFDALLPDLPEEIVRSGPKDPLADFNLLCGATILDVTDQRFARAENLISPYLPTFDPELYGAQGKIMDSWETARHNPLPADTLLLALATPSPIRYVSISTRYHYGNHPETIRLWGASDVSDAQHLQQDAQHLQWEEFLPLRKLEGHAECKIVLDAPTKRFAAIKVAIAPDGGLTRLGLYDALPLQEQPKFLPSAEAHCVRYTDPIPHCKKPLVLKYLATPEEIERNLAHFQHRPFDLACASFGGKLTRATNEFYGPAAQLLSPFPPLHMFDGLESARSREPGHVEEVEIELARKALIRRLVMDFQFFVNNNPLFVSVDAWNGEEWQEIIPHTRVKAFAANQKEFYLQQSCCSKRLRVRIYPDGGINRIHVFEE